MSQPIGLPSPSGILQPIGLPSPSGISQPIQVVPSSGAGGQLFLNPSTSSADEASLLDLWNVDPSTPTSQKQQDWNELVNSPSLLSTDVALLIGNPNTGSFYSSQTQRDLLFSLDHDPLTRSNFMEAALHAIDFALADPNSQVTASDKAGLQAEGKQIRGARPGTVF